MKFSFFFFHFICKCSAQNVAVYWFQLRGHTQSTKNHFWFEERSLNHYGWLKKCEETKRIRLIMWCVTTELCRYERSRRLMLFSRMQTKFSFSLGLVLRCVLFFFCKRVANWFCSNNIMFIILPSTSISCNPDTMLKHNKDFRFSSLIQLINNLIAYRT